MRQLLLTLVVFSFSAVALFRPKFGILSYVWFSLMRPDVLAYADSMGGMYSFSLAICTLIGSCRYIGRMLPLLANPIVIGLFLLQLPLAASVQFAVDPALAVEPYLFFLRILLMALLLPVLNATYGDIRALALVFAASLGLLGAKFGLYGLAKGGVRFNVGYGGMVSDNNDLALLLAMGVPLCWYAQKLVRSRWLKLVFLGFAFTSTAAVVMTYSRGGAAAVGAVFFAIVFYSKRRAATLALLALLTTPVLLLLGNSYFDRLSTLGDVRNEASANSRLVFAQTALTIWRDHPLLGVGFGMNNYAAIAPLYMETKESLVVHNTYLQMLADSGIVAFSLYIALLFGTIWWLGHSASRMERNGIGMDAVPRGFQIALIAFLVGSISLSRIHFELLWMLIAGAAAWWQMEKNLVDCPAVTQKNPLRLRVVSVPMTHA